MIDLFSEEMRRNPFPVYEHLRETSPLFHDLRSDMWMIFDYDGVKWALGDHESFGSSLMTLANRSTPDWLVFQDPPRHSKLRTLIARAFTPSVVAGLAPRIGELSRDLLDRIVERGEMDLAADYAVPLPMMVIAEMIGIPADDWPRFRRWSDGILKISFSIPGSDPAVEAAAMAEFYAAHGEIAAYLPELVEERRRAPCGDLLTRLVEAEVDGQRLSMDELLSFFQLLLVAGNETTANLINNAVLSFLENPVELARLRAAPSLLPSAIEEVLRYRSPLQWMFRATRRDVELHGGTIPAGQIVLAVIGSANRDSRMFPNPDRFDISRDPNPHLAFGHGPHVCMGAALARMEAKIALSDLLERLQDLELASTEPWPPCAGLHVYGPSRLPIRFTPARSAAAAL